MILWFYEYSLADQNDMPTWRWGSTALLQYVASWSKKLMSQLISYLKVWISHEILVGQR